MKAMVIALSAAVVMATAPAVFAQGVSSKAPGQEMQRQDMQQTGSKKGEPGASSYAPGHKKQHAKASKKTSPGASGYAPGQTTGASTKPTTGSSTKSGY
ncbi:hypothetical protein JQ596_22480 [Bradyrhizobium manausense]|uniref:hypothetical protein n=1 Tax=Bradyrhizobium TaxID=374 RepID=UPI001BAE2EA8|nr:MULTISPECIES: hypothetical protein [Bradyrhizobium]MBR0828306.1 hypothetical protein [Bradyrhizobium manausense]UVO25622.1 hypothetical protein KUF59_23820 [Bradyrhizobium arachidis]